MSESRRPSSLGRYPVVGVCPARPPGSVGKRVPADPSTPSLLGNTPGPLGHDDHADPPQLLLASPGPEAGSSHDTESGSIPVGIGSLGMAAVARIPVPGSNGLFVELSPRGYTPAGGSTSTLFIQDPSGKRHLRLDYGYNKTTGRVDYHWNQKGTFAQFQTAGHTPAGTGGKALYKGAKYLRYGGRMLIVVGLATDAISIVTAEKRLRQVLRVASGWAGAWGGCKLVGAGGAAAGTLVKPGGGTAVGGLVGCISGGIGGYAGASWAAGEAYDYIEETYFVPLPEASPAEAAQAVE